MAEDHKQSKEEKKALPKAPPVAVEQADAARSSVWPGAFEAFTQVFHQIRKNPEPALVYMGVYVILAALDLAIFRGSVSTSASTTSVWGETNRDTFKNIGYLIFLLATPVYALALADRRSISVAEFLRFDAKKYFSILLAVILSVGIFVLSAIPLLIPLIWTIPWFILVSYVITDKGAGPIQGLSGSKRLAQNHKGKVWGVIGVTILLGIGAGLLSLIPLLGSVVAAFVNLWAAGTLATLYRWLQKQHADEV